MADDQSTYGCVWAIRVAKEKWFNPRDLPGYDRNIPDKWQLPSWIMINPPLVTDRLVKQSGKFSYHPDDKDLDLSNLERAPEEELWKFTITPDKDGKNPTRHIREQLGILNIHHASLFPDSDGISIYINEQWRHIAAVTGGA
jgi:hypothetical protein